jgi:signal transduction histidine kinase
MFVRRCKPQIIGDTHIKGGSCDEIAFAYSCGAHLVGEKKVGLALQASGERVRGLPDDHDRFWNLSDQFIAKITDDGQILLANPAAIALLEGRPLAQSINAADRQLFRDALRESCAQKSTVRFNARIIAKEQEILQFRWSVACDGEGDALYIIGHDITDLVERQNRTRLAESRLAQVQRMETLGELASGIAHDFNNLLVPILTVLDLLRRRPSGDAEFDELTQGAAHAAENARAMVKRILDFSKNQHLPMTRFKLGSVLRDVEILARQMLPDNIQLSLSIASKLPQISLPPQQLEVTLINLVLNARDAMKDGGVVTLAAAQDPAQKLVHIQVVDQGCGMDSETAAKAMQRFFTTKGREKGTGLGLYMARRFAEQCGGALTIESEVGVGTTITLSLPVGDGTRSPRQKANITDQT